MGRVKNMKLGQQLGSDHKFVTLRLAGMEPKREDRLREVWRTGESTSNTGGYSIVC